MEIINTIALWTLIAYLFAKPFIERIEVKIKRTFWKKKPYGIQITIWRYKITESANYGTCVFDWDWRKPNKRE